MNDYSEAAFQNYAGPGLAKVLRDIPAIRITFQQQLDEGKRAIAFETHVQANCETAELNERLDKIRRSAERQKAIIELPSARTVLVNLEANLKRETDKYLALQAEEDVFNSNWEQARLASNRRDLKPSQSQIGEKKRIVAGQAAGKKAIEDVHVAIAVQKKAIEELEKRAAEE